MGSGFPEMTDLSWIHEPIDNTYGELASNKRDGYEYFAGGIGAEIRKQLNTDFGRSLFDNYWFSDGHMNLSKAQFDNIVKHAGIVTFSNPVVLSNGQPGVAQLHNFYGNNNPFNVSLGHATIYYQDGIPVGFHDNYNFNWRRFLFNRGRRSFNAEIKTRMVGTAGFFRGATPFDLSYGLQPLY